MSKMYKIRALAFARCSMMLGFPAYRDCCCLKVVVYMFQRLLFVSNVMCCSSCIHLSMVLLEEFSAGDAFGESRGAGQEPS